MTWRPKYGVLDIDPDFIIPAHLLIDYDTLNYTRKFIKSDNIKRLYNKFHIKQEFIKSGFNVPLLYNYWNQKTDILNTVKNYETFVLKPAHMSFSDGVFIKKNKDTDVSKINDYNIYLDVKTERDEPIMLQEAERGIIVEEFIKTVYELKVFVIWGCPFICDLRKGPTEFHRIGFIDKNNEYINWNKEYDLICDFANLIKLDFFRIDFLYDGERLFASECAFMPSTDLPSMIEDYISKFWTEPYYKFYYPFLSNK